VHIRSLREVLDREPQLVQPYLDRRPAVPAGPFAALNAAFLDDGAFVSVPKAMVLAEPIHVVFLSAPGSQSTASHPRVLVWAGRKSQAADRRELRRARGRGVPHQRVSEVTLEDGAVVDHYRLQRESARAFHVGTLCATQGRASRFARTPSRSGPRSAAWTSARSSRAKAASAS
jgi:Fe-S cluster assembly protein SufD